MTELSFLIDLLLNHKLPKVTRDAVAQRIKEVEARPMQVSLGSGVFPQQSHFKHPPEVTCQAPSTIAAMARHGDLAMQVSLAPPPEPPPVAIVAQTPAAVAAMNSRNQAIAESMSGKVDKTTGRPRKF